MSAKTEQPDPAAIFAGALSLWNAVRAAHDQMEMTLSDAYNGADECMRQVMRVATLFEEWACRHVAFDELDEMWAYLLDSRLGEACIDSMTVSSLTEFDEAECFSRGEKAWASFAARRWASAAGRCRCTESGGRF